MGIRSILLAAVAVPVLAGRPVGPAGAASKPSSRASRPLQPAQGAEGRLPASAATELDWPSRIRARLAAVPDVQLADGKTPDARMRRDLARAVSGRPAHMSVGIHIRDLGTGQVVYDRLGAMAQNPASNQKLLTTVAATTLLGADYHYETRVLHQGDALYVVGEGDPSLQVDDVYRIAEAVHRANVPVRRVIVDDSAFSERRFGPGYDEGGPGYSYMAPSGALSLQFNTVQITVTPNERGAAPTVHVDPPSDYLVVRNTARSARTGEPKVRTYAEGDTTVVEVSGTVGPAPVSIRRRVADPGLFFGATLARVLRELGGQEPKATRGVVPDDARLLKTHRSAPLGEVLRAALKFSNNFTSEQLLRTLAWRATGKPGDWNTGVHLLHDFWAAKGGGPLEFENGSGLSHVGRVTPRGVVDLVGLAMRDGSDASAVLPALPAAGRDGTLRRRLAPSDGRVRAKTGTMGGVSALSGVVVSEDGRRRLGFSILLNGAFKPKQATALQDRVVLAMLRHTTARDPR